MVPDAELPGKDEFWMARAIELARQGALKGEVPVGAVLIGADNLCLAESANGPIRLSDPTAHAEILTLRAAAKKSGNYRLPETILYVTLEPCIMCMGAIIHARVSRLVFGAADKKSGAAGSLYNIGGDGRLNHSLKVHGGILEDQCGQLLVDFFEKKRHKRGKEHKH
jgi:tRNA(adenine34) deaminase